MFSREAPGESRSNASTTDLGKLWNGCGMCKGAMRLLAGFIIGPAKIDVASVALKATSVEGVGRERIMEGMEFEAR